MRIPAGLASRSAAWRLAVGLAALGGLCLVASILIAMFIADHSSSDSSPSSLIAIGLGGFGFFAALAGALLGAGIALTRRLRHPRPAAARSRNAAPEMTARQLWAWIPGPRALQAAIALAAAGGACLLASFLLGLLGARLPASASSVVSLIAGPLAALGFAAVGLAIVIPADAGLARLWRRIRRPRRGDAERGGGERARGQ